MKNENTRNEHVYKYLVALRKHELVNEFTELAKTTATQLEQIAGGFRKAGLTPRKYEQSATSLLVEASQTINLNYGIEPLTYHMVRPDFYPQDAAA